MEIKELDLNKFYKYLVVNEANGINHYINKEKRQTILLENKSQIKNIIESKK